MSYVVTNVRLEESVYRALKLRALEKSLPASTLIREAIRQYLGASGVGEIDWEHEKAELLKMCGKIGGRGRSARTASTDIDDVLYGPRKYRPKKR